MFARQHGAFLETFCITIDRATIYVTAILFWLQNAPFSIAITVIGCGNKENYINLWEAALDIPPRWANYIFSISRVAVVLSSLISATEK